MTIGLLFAIVIALIVLVAVIKTAVIVPQKTAYIVERLGRYRCTLDAGFHILVPFIDRIAYKHTLKEQAIDVPPQECITKDNIMVSVDGILYMQVMDPAKASYGIGNYLFATTQLAQTTMRSEMGKLDLDRSFEERTNINQAIVAAVDKASDPWGIKVTRYEIKNITPPQSIQDAMEKQMRAEREKRAMIAESEGERQSKINRAEGERQQAIALSEGERARRINEAEGKAKEILLVAEAQAAGIAKVADAISGQGGLESVNMQLAQQYLAQFGNLAKTNNTMIIPSNLADVAGVLKACTGVVKKVGACVTGAIAGSVFAMTVSGCRTFEMQPGEKCEFEFPFMGNYDVVNRVTFDWHDTYVTNSSSVYHQELAGPLAALAASTYGYRMRTDIRSLMDLGFPPEQMYRCYGKDLSYRHPKYGRDRVGYTIAYRHSELPGADYDIVMVLCRGTFGREEWLSNLNMANEWGKDPALPADRMPQFHEGFSKAADDVMEALAKYAADNRVDLSKAKILVAGHSRGGSVANLIGSRLDDAAEGPKTSPFAGVRRENVYVYTIACPNVTIRVTPEATSPKYGNIFNIISPEDVVPMLPFPAWHGARYGHTLILKSFNYLPLTGSWTNSGYCDMKDAFRDVCGYEYHHMLLGTNIAARIPEFALKICPSIADFYWVHPGIREEGGTSCTHAFFEMILWKVMPSAETQERNISLCGDIATLTSTYDRLVNNSIEKKEEDKRDHRFRFVLKRDEDGPFNPDGRDFSRQPGFFDIGWKFTCMHATQTYVSWMKSASENGPDEIFVNWDEENGGEGGE